MVAPSSVCSRAMILRENVFRIGVDQRGLDALGVGGSHVDLRHGDAGDAEHDPLRIGAFGRAGLVLAGPEHGIERIGREIALGAVALQASDELRLGAEFGRDLADACGLQLLDRLLGLFLQARGHLVVAPALDHAVAHLVERAFARGRRRHRFVPDIAVAAGKLDRIVLDADLGAEDAVEQGRIARAMPGTGLPSGPRPDRSIMSTVRTVRPTFLAISASERAGAALVLDLVVLRADVACARVRARDCA